MRKILLSILVCIMLILSSVFIIKGLNKMKVSGVLDINEKDEVINKKIAELSDIISTTYTNTQSNLKKTATTLQSSKTEYETQAALSAANSSSYIANREKYDIDYLWTKLGNYARSETVVIKIDVSSSGSSSDLYNLNFSVVGGYVNITDFIYDIENDSKLGFKIDNFKLSGTDTLEATFVCQDIPINLGKLETTESVQPTKENDNSQQSNTTQQQTNTTNNTVDASTGNTTGNTTANTNREVSTNTTNTNQ